MIDRIIKWFHGEEVVPLSEFSFVATTLHDRIAELEAENEQLKTKLRAAARATSRTRQANIKAAPVKKAKK